MRDLHDILPDEYKVELRERVISQSPGLNFEELLALIASFPECEGPLFGVLIKREKISKEELERARSVAAGRNSFWAKKISMEIRKRFPPRSLWKRLRLSCAAFAEAFRIKEDPTPNEKSG